MKTRQEMLDIYKNKYGIHFDKFNPLICDSEDSYRKEALKVAKDEDFYIYNPASNGVPAWMTLVNMNKIIPQLLIKRAYTEIGEPMQQGSFETNKLQYALIGLNGEVEPYSDFSGTLKSDINATFVTRDVFRAQTVIEYGELETATMSTAKIDAVSQKQYSASMNIAIAQNKLFFFGNVNSAGAFISSTFGLLNDPGLNAAVPATNGGSSSPLWSVKSQSPTGATDIANDVVVTAFKEMQDQMGGQIRLDDEFYLCVSTTASAYLNTTNQFSLNPVEIIKKTMPNIKFIYAPEYSTINSFQLIAAKSIGENLVKDLFTYKVRAHNIVPQLSSYNQKWSFGSAGCAILQYAPIVTISGIE